MIATKETVYTKDLANKKIKAVREFAAPVEKVWRAWTESAMLEQWWAPKPYKAVTQEMHFHEGGFWRYYMLGPEGERHYCRLDYRSIVPNSSYDVIDAFCDEKGELNTEMPRMNWHVAFYSTDSGTRAEIEISFKTVEDLQKIVEMGFEEGFRMAHGNLDELLATI
jgi:uncharacterized protein YndB with AHSA1/START domain